jgi:hypothetical protein
MQTQPESTNAYPGYAGLTGAFALGTGAAIAALHRTGRLPTRFSPGDIALLGAATYQLSRTLTRDRVTAFLRAPFAREGESVGRGEVESEVRGSGARRAIGALVVCPFCMTQWVAAGFLSALCVAPRPTRFVASLLVVRTVAEVANIAHEAAVAEADRLERISEMGTAKAA